ncbi:hypothetical protein BH09MYX1_BH09MYX1_00050 [soil metagenome]
MVKLTHRTFLPIVWVALGGAIYCGVVAADVAKPTASIAHVKLDEQSRGATRATSREDRMSAREVLRDQQDALVVATNATLARFDRRAEEALVDLDSARATAASRSLTRRNLDAYPHNVRTARRALDEASAARDSATFEGAKQRLASQLSALEDSLDVPAGSVADSTRP